MKVIEQKIRSLYHSTVFLWLVSAFIHIVSFFEFASAAILFVFHQSQDLVPRSSHSLIWPPFWINFHSPWTNQSRDFYCVPGSSLLPPPYWKARRPRERGWVRKPVPLIQNPRGGSKTVLNSLTWGELMTWTGDDPRFTTNYDLTRYFLQFVQINTRLLVFSDTVLTRL